MLNKSVNDDNDENDRKEAKSEQKSWVRPVLVLHWDMIFQRKAIEYIIQLNIY